MKIRRNSPELTLSSGNSIKSCNAEPATIPDKSVPPVPAPKVSMAIVGADVLSGEESNVYVIKAGAHYAVDIQNHGAVDVETTLYIDGKKIGSFLSSPGVKYQPIERPTWTSMKFTFYSGREH